MPEPNEGGWTAKPNAIATGTFCCAMLAASAALGQQGAPRPHLEKVEVRIRSVLVFLADSKGNVPTTPPDLRDFVATYDRTPVEIVAIEPMHRFRSTEDHSAAGTSAGESRIPSGGVAQYLYLDTTALNLRSIPLVARVFQAHVDEIVANGTLEIVSADPEPTLVLAATNDIGRIRAVLDKLPDLVTGKQRLLSLRSDSLRELRDAQNRARSAAAGSVRAHVRMAVAEEISLLRQSLARLEAWAAARPEGQAAVLYYANDGFDANPVEIYRDSISAQDPEMRREVDALELELSKEVPKLLESTRTTLAGKGLTTIPLALGGTLAEYAGNAASIGVRGGAALRRPTDSAPLFFYARPTESLGTIAAATGGQVVTTASKFGKVVDAVGNAFLVFFRVPPGADGRAHDFELAATRPDLKVRAPRHLLVGSPRTTSIQRATRVLEGTELPGDVRVTVVLGDVSRAGSGQVQGMLRIAANFGAVRDVLVFEERVPLRLSLAVEIAGADPFTFSEEIDWTADSASWRYQVPLTWTREARRIAVMVEEVSTGLAGAAVVNVPPPD